MKTKNTSDYIIAAIVVGCSVILLAALTMAITGFSLARSGKKIAIDFPSVAGIRVNSEVRYAGKHVGTIKEIRFLTAEQRLEHPENMVRAIAVLDSDAPTLYRGTMASIISDTVLAEKFVDLIPLKIPPNEKILPPLEADDIIQGSKVVGFDDITRAGYSTLTIADVLISKINEILERNDAKLEKTLSDLRVTMQNLKVTTTYSKAFTETIGERPWRIIWGGDPNVLPTEEEILKSDKPLPAPVKEDAVEENQKIKKTKSPHFSSR